MDRRVDRIAVKLARRHRCGDHPLSCRRRRPDRSGDFALGHRISLLAAGGAALESAVAGAAGLAGCRRIGLCFFGLFFVLYNIAISFTTAARASLALATLPLHTMVVATLLGVEPLTIRKTAGVCIAVFGVVAALAVGLSAAPSGAWRGELIMTGAVFCMAFYNVLSRPFIRRSSALGFLTVGMGSGAAALMLTGAFTGSFAALERFGTPQWIAGIYLGVGGGALAFILWVLALERATPTRVANTMTVNPIAAALLAALLVGEPITPNLVFGLIAVFAGIWIATSDIKKSDIKKPSSSIRGHHDGVVSGQSAGAGLEDHK
jgi:drug/metabolite transporter (DMT)-like permease